MHSTLRGRRRWLLRALGLALAPALGLAVSGCSHWSDLQFTQDHRLEFTHPASYQQVHTPFTLRWTMSDFHVLDKGTDATPRDDAGYFAVFIDLAPIKPGRTLDSLASDDPACRRDPHCPDRGYLQSLGVYVVHEPQLRLSVVAPLPSKERVQLHQATVILLDAAGRRIGEYAWYREFKMVNRTPSA